MDRPMRALSGGWRVRAALAAALFAKPDVLLLDEPTNHLSIAAVLWLARELSCSSTWQSRVVVVVSHDRHVLDAATTDSLHISGAARKLTLHRMCYSAWAEKREEQQKALQKRAQLRNEKKTKLEAYAGHGFKHGGSSSQINMMQRKANEAAKLDEEGGGGGGDGGSRGGRRAPVEPRRRRKTSRADRAARGRGVQVPRDGQRPIRERRHGPRQRLPRVPSRRKRRRKDDAGEGHARAFGANARAGHRGSGGEGGARQPAPRGPARVRQDPARVHAGQVSGRRSFSTSRIFDRTSRGAV